MNPRDVDAASPMPVGQWARVAALFELCLDQPAGQQATLLAQSLETPEVVAEVERLLRHDRESGEFLEDIPAVVKELHTPPEARFAPGDWLGGRYEIQRLLGRGGTGEVYAAFDHHAETAVALKVLAAGCAAGLAGLQRELRLGRQVTHPHVCRLFDLGRHDGAYFLTMELLEGETLAARLRRAGPLALTHAEPVIDQLLDGLEAIHDAGIVHRDLSPANIMLLPGRAVIMDFGLAALIGQPAGETAGTLDYMAPERLEGHPSAVPADVYSLGGILHEMLSGHRPSAGLPPGHGWPLDWVRAIRAALSTDPASRPASTMALRNLLADPLPLPLRPVPRLPVPRLPRQRRPAALRHSSRATGRR